MSLNSIAVGLIITLMGIAEGLVVTLIGAAAVLGLITLVWRTYLRDRLRRYLFERQARRLLDAFYALSWEGWDRPTNTISSRSAAKRAGIPHNKNDFLPLARYLVQEGYIGQAGWMMSGRSDWHGSMYVITREGAQEVERRRYPP
jgi:hypothetical protein